MKVWFLQLRASQLSTSGSRPAQKHAAFNFWSSHFAILLEALIKEDIMSMKWNAEEIYMEFMGKQWKHLEADGEKNWQVN